LDYQIAAHSSVWKGELKKLQAVKKRLTRGGTKEERKALRGEAKQLKQEISRLQEQVIEEILGDAQVLCCTNVGAADRVFRRYLPNRVFDLVVIDECGQALEVGCWIPLLKGKRALLAGDHKQLPPTIQGTQDSPLAYTLFSRAMEELPHIPSTMLKVQYRMNSAIMGWSNQQFYQGQLRAHSSVEEHTLRQLCEQL
jgi:ATP-dependent RNA/DNA helicase IGHMBP2